MIHVASFYNQLRQSWQPVGFHSGRVVYSIHVDYDVYVLPVVSYLKISVPRPSVVLYIESK